MRHCAYLSIALLLLASVAAGCSDESGESSETSSLRDIPKIDIHTHYDYPREYLVPLLEEWNMRAVIVEVVKEPTRQRWAAMKAHEAQEPEHFILATSFDASNIDEPNFAEEVIAGLKEDLAAGAKMVKVWKNVGIVYKDESGEYIQIDDPRFQPIWDFLAEEGMPMLAHIGEPRAAWLPLDEDGPHFDYYSNNPEYHTYNDPTAPRWEEIMAARDRWLERNPNFYVETAERFGDLANQDSEKVRRFFIDYQDRVIFGTDLRSREPAEDLTEEELREQHEDVTARRYQLTWDYITSSDSMNFERTGTPFRTRTKGLGLPPDVVKKFYYDNATRLLELEPAKEEV